MTVDVSSNTWFISVDRSIWFTIIDKKNICKAVVELSHINVYHARYPVIYTKQGCQKSLMINIIMVIMKNIQLIT